MINANKENQSKSSAVHAPVHPSGSTTVQASDKVSVTAQAKVSVTTQAKVSGTTPVSANVPLPVHAPARSPQIEIEKNVLLNFHQLNLSVPIAKALEEMGYQTPTPIQADTLPILLRGPTDFLGLAATGTGKTAAFGIPLLENIDVMLSMTQSLILVPTRELALQVCDQIKKIGRHTGVRALTVYGGAGYNDQISGLKRGAHIVVATPGRLVDHIKRGTFKLNQVRTVVLDEADEMISMGFKEDMEVILNATHDPSLLQQKCNTWLFSATMNTQVRNVANRHLKNPQFVQVNKTEMLSGTVQQIYYVTREGNKPDVLCKIIDAAENFYGLVFCQTKALVSEVSLLLQNRGYKVDCLHGDKDQNSRERILNMFRNRKVTILVCTDVAARGLDVKDLTHVVNYSIPRELDSYVHRIGRTARSGKPGLAISLVTQSHMGLISRIEKMTRSKMRAGVIPTRKDIGTKKIAEFLPKFMGAIGFERAAAILDPAWIEALEKMPKAEVVGRFLALSYQDLFVDKEKPAAAENAKQPTKERKENPFRETSPYAKKNNRNNFRRRRH